MTQTEPHVVIVGGGFGGLYAAKALRKAAVRVTLIDRRNYHLFQPLLYQVATATLSPANVARPIRQILRRQQNAEVVLAEVTHVDPADRAVELATGQRVHYDYLILAAGAVDQYFGHDHWAPLAPGLKTVDDATEIRRRFLLAFEAAERNEDPARAAALLTFVIVGAGPTGVEMAGAFAEMARHTLRHDFRRINSADARIILIDGGDRVLSGYDASLSIRAQQQLTSLGVEVRLNARVTDVQLGAVIAGDERIAAYNIVWAAGVGASPLGRRLEVPVDRGGRVLVEPDLSVPGYPEIFAVGDLAASIDPETGKALPGVAQVALQGGRHAARNILRTLRHQPREPFHYRDKGSMATIGRAKAVAQIGSTRLSGLPAWLVWLFVHILFLIGFRNRIVVMVDWAWSYLTWQRSARLITGDLRPGNVLKKLGLEPPPERGSETEQERAIEPPPHLESPDSPGEGDAANPPSAA